MTARRRKADPFQGAFVSLPTEPMRRLDALCAVNKEFRRALAGQLQPVLRLLLQQSPPENDQGRKQLARQVNFMLHDAGLALVDPDSGQVSTIVADPWRLMLQSRAKNEEGRRTRSRNIESLPPLELVEHIRQEPFLTWQGKIARADAADKRRR